MADVKWIKIVTDLFDDEKIRIIESMPKGDTLLVIWLKLLTLAGKQNNSGVFTVNGIAYTDEMFAAMFSRPLAVVKSAMQTFAQYGMIRIVNGTVTVPNWEKHQQLDALQNAKELTRQRVTKFREKQKAIVTEGVTESECNAECNVTGNVTVTSEVTPCNAPRIRIRERDIDLDLEKRELEKKDAAVAATPRHKYGAYQNVLLSDGDMEKLKAEFPDWQQRIERLSEYIASKGASYKNHLATIRAWARKDAERPSAQAKVNPALQYTQRDYSDADLDAVIFDPLAEVGQ